VSQDGKPPSPGLRERKKAKTRAAIQEHALRLFQEQGYDATTVEQIAEAAEVSPSTFFRYFPTKEDVVLYDDTDPLFIAAFEAQPSELTPIQAMRGAMLSFFINLPAEEMAKQWERGRLILAVPELRMRFWDQIADAIQLLAALVAKRVGRRADDPDVLTFTGAVTGALLSTMLANADKLLANADRLEENYAELIDSTLAYLEAGMPL
jgi:AcrR family transcriptional regulator